MIKTIKKIAYKILPLEQYLRTLHWGFFILYKTNLLKNNPKFKFHYMVRKLVKPEDTVVDIGANLGYFAKTFAELTPRGKVLCIEPVPRFYQVLKYFLGKYPHVEIKNIALGSKEGEVTMVLPESEGMIRTGLPHITSGAKNSSENTIQVKIKKAADILGTLNKIDYIKCDVEGHEMEIFSGLTQILKKHKPLIQVEISHQNKNNLLNFFKELGYEQYGIAKGKIVKEEWGKQQESGDYLLIDDTKKIAGLTSPKQEK